MIGSEETLQKVKNEVAGLGEEIEQELEEVLQIRTVSIQDDRTWQRGISALQRGVRDVMQHCHTAHVSAGDNDNNLTFRACGEDPKQDSSNDQPPPTRNGEDCGMWRLISAALLEQCQDDCASGRLV